MRRDTVGKVREPITEYIVDKKGKKKKVVLEVDAYEKLLEDLDDLAAMLSRKNEPSIPWEEVKKKLKKDGLL